MASSFPKINVGKITYNSIEVSWENDKRVLHHIQISKARSRSPSPGAPAIDPMTNYQGYGNCHVFKSLEPNTEYLIRARFVEASQASLGHGSMRWSQPNHVTTAKEPPSGAELHRAVARQDLDGVKKILSENNSVVEVMDKMGHTPLMVAAQKGFVDVMETLLEFGADPNYVNVSGKTCMMIASYAGQEEPVKLLREKGVEWGSRDKNGLTAVHWAADGSHDDLLLFILREGAEVDAEDSVNGWTPLMRIACLTGNDEVAEVLIAKGANVKHVDKSGKTVLMAASMNGHFNLVRLLVEKGADIMAKNREGKSALEFAQSFERHRIIKYLEFQLQKEEKQRKAQLLEERSRQLREESSKNLEGVAAKVY